MTRRLRTVRTAAAAWLLVVLCGLSLACSADSAVVATVVSVSDGDTFVALQDGRRFKVRLAEIDAPERGQPWSSRAREALRDKVMNMRVRLDVVDTDRYGRSVARVWLGNRDVNRELVREGYAWVYTRYLRDETLRIDENRAREARTGLWSMPDPVEPWRWREAQRKR